MAGHGINFKISLRISRSIKCMLLGVVAFTCVLSAACSRFPVSTAAEGYPFVSSGDVLPEATETVFPTDAPASTASPAIPSSSVPLGETSPAKGNSPDHTAAPSGNMQEAKRPGSRPEEQATASPGPSLSVPVTTASPEVNRPSGGSKPVSGGQPVSIARDPVKAAVNLRYKVPEALKEDYDRFCRGISEQASCIVFEKELTSAEIYTLIYYVRDYNPQYFYVDWTKFSTSRKVAGGITLETTIKPTYKQTRSQQEIAAVENIVNQVLRQANQKPNLFEREVYVHDYLVKHVQYDKTTDNCGSIYGALVEGRAKCEGYARAFQYIMNRLGMETVLITGRAGGEPHMWNMVKLYTHYYFVDVTHDDPSPDVPIADGQEYLINRSCLNVSTGILSATHTIHGKNSKDNYGMIQNADLQNCNSLTYHYYTVRGQSVSTLGEFQAVLRRNKGIHNVEVYFSGSMPSVSALKDAVNAFIKQEYPNKGYRYSYTNAQSSVYKRHVFRVKWTIQ